MLAVYADPLQELDDPRGELIAIDLAHPGTALAARKRELIDRWLGAEIATRVLAIVAARRSRSRSRRSSPTTLAERTGDTVQIRRWSLFR